MPNFLANSASNGEQLRDAVLWDLPEKDRLVYGT